MEYSMNTLTVAKVEVLSKDALNELITIYGLYKFASLQTVLRQVTKKLLHHFDQIEWFVYRPLFQRGYRMAPAKFVALWKRKVTYKIFVQISKQNHTQLHFRVGYEAESFCFATVLSSKLSDPRVASIDVPLSEIPQGYGYSLKNKLEKKLGIPIKRIDLGETIRFYKPKQK